MANVEIKPTTSSKKSPRPLRANKQKRISKLSKEQLELALRKKRECNGKALKIVEALIEQRVDNESFLEKVKLNDINQSHYDDIVDERWIVKLCGYPLCDETLTNVPTKQYHISTSTNKVYDIKDRKKFCSNMCFKSSNYLKEQLLTSPLWLRDQEVLPVIKLLPHKVKNNEDNSVDVDVDVVKKLTSLTLQDIQDNGNDLLSDRK